VAFAKATQFYAPGARIFSLTLACGLFMICSMSATASETLADRTPTSFEEFRELWEAEDPQKGLAGLLQRWISRLLTALAALLAEVRAAKLDDAPCATSAPCAAGAPCAASAPCAEAAAADVCAADGGAGLLSRMAMASRNGGAGEARRARAQAVHAAKRRWSRLAPRRAASGVLVPIATQGAHFVRIVPLTLPCRAPFLPAKMGTRRGPHPFPQGPSGGEGFKIADAGVLLRFQKIWF
jgi:hypothetical protein